MTAAGQSALNVQGLDTVIIDDTRFANVVEQGRNVLTRLHLGANEILQMAGRVHGRVAGGRVAVRLHLLGPNYRPQQVTDDLASFWANVYPRIRKELRARYPKHAWPEDPLTAPAQRGPKRRG